MTSARIYLDANTIIKLHEPLRPVDEDHRLMLKLVAAAMTPIFLTSELTLAEVLVWPLRERKAELVLRYENWLVPNAILATVPVTKEILRHAAILRAAHKSLKLPDAIHLGTALEHRCTHFLTFEKRLDENYAIFASESPKADAGGIRVLNPASDVIDDLIRTISS